MIRWFADLPIERKLRVVIMVPALAAFAIAMLLHLATNLWHLRQDMEQRATRIGRVVGADTIVALRLGDDKAALKSLGALRDERAERFPSVVSCAAGSQAWPGRDHPLRMHSGRMVHSG